MFGVHFTEIQLLTYVVVFKFNHFWVTYHFPYLDHLSGLVLAWVPGTRRMLEDHVWHPRILRVFMLLAPSELPSMYQLAPSFFFIFFFIFNISLVGRSFKVLYQSSRSLQECRNRPDVASIFQIYNTIHLKCLTINYRDRG